MEKECKIPNVPNSKDPRKRQWRKFVSARGNWMTPTLARSKTDLDSFYTEANNVFALTTSWPISSNFPAASNSRGAIHDPPQAITHFSLR